MNNFKYKSILYFIGLVILATLCIQVYWNYKNYQIGKQQLLNDVQTSLDNAVDRYYTQLATGTTFDFKEGIPNRFLKDTMYAALGDSIRVIVSDSLHDINLQTERLEGMSKSISVLRSVRNDSTNVQLLFGDSMTLEINSDSMLDRYELLTEPVERLSSKILISISKDRLSLATIDSLFSSELERKSITAAYGLSHKDNFLKADTLRPQIVAKSALEAVSKSPYFFHGNRLKAHFINITLAVLKKNLLGILLSFILVGSVIFCLLYLLKIIKQQKQLAEVKNDLISNITHEFKTPIATIGIAMEAIQNFNTENDMGKNLRYAKISEEQVGKLNVMVEKLLETATLDSEKLELNLEPIDLVQLLRKATYKEIVSREDKVIKCNSPEEKLVYPIDGFHFENAINNMVDNALKYGGKEITVALQKKKNYIEITVCDSGSSLTETHRNKIFEKFYRVPKGNTHDVKGFGIGLYYTKKIIEKHGGSLSLSISPTTCFSIQLPHE